MLTAGVRSRWRSAAVALLFGLLAFSAARVVPALTSQTITFGALPGKTYGNPPFTVTATASSGLPVSFASLTTSVCTVSGSTVTIVAAGTCTIQASQAGNATYAAAPNVNQSFTVAKASQTITFGALSPLRMDQSPLTVSATASSGLAVTFTSTTTAVCTISGATVTLKAVGTCTIQAAQAGNANYNAAPNVSQSFVVSKGNQTITFGALASRALGSGTFTVSATASSALAVTFTSTTTTICTVGGSTVTLVAVGTCTIQAAQAGNANWNAATSVSQSFSVTKGNQTITFGALANRALGSGTFTLTATASSGLTVAFASLTTSICTVNVKTVTLVAMGTCTIQASQAGNANWNAAPNVNQSFTVTPAVQTINFPGIAPQLWGPSTPAVSATASSGLPVAYASLTPSYCSVNGYIVTLLNVGSCTILATQAGNANWLPANASQTFAIIAPLQFAYSDLYSAGRSPWGIAAGDFGSDGKRDIAVASTGDNNVALLFGAGDGTLTLGATLAGGNFPQAMTAGDLNGDGRPDLVVANALDSTVKIYLGNGDNTFAVPQTRAVRPSPTALALADVNGDGKLDLVVANGYTGDTSGSGAQGASVEVFLGNGNGTFQTSTVYAVSSNAQGVAIADVNGDGKPDLLVTSGFNNLFNVLPGRGDGTFTTGNTYATQGAPAGIAVADFNGDGKLDVVVANSQSGTLSLYLGNGNGTFGAATITSVDVGLLSVVVADLNGDGRPDLAVTTASGVHVLAGMGNGTFAPPAPMSFAFGATSLAAVDLNGDGRLDLVATAYADEVVVAFLNIGVVGSGATIVAQTGTPQSANVGATFATPLSVLVRSSTNQPLPGESVIFIAPSVGPSGYFNPPDAQVTTDGSGIATAPTFIAGSIPGAFSVLASIGSASTNFALTILGSANQAPAFLSAPLPNGALNAPYAYTVSASGSPAPTISTPAGSLPPGLTLDGASGLVSGTPGTAGTYLGTLTAANGVPPDATQAFNVTIAAGTTQTITFPAIANVTLGVAPFTVNATASSGLAVTFTSLTTSVCTVSATTVTVVAAGTCTIQASQAGNATYAPAPNVSRSFTVAKMAQTITFGALFDRMLGSGTFVVSATASSGLAVTFSSLTTPVCTVSVATVTLVTTGTCTIRAAQAGNATYAAAANVDQSFTVSASGTNQPPTIVFVTPASGNTYVAPAVVPLYVTASDPDGTLVKVEFYNGAILLGTATSAPYRYVWTDVAAGAYTVSAKAYDNLGATTTTASVGIVVNASGSGATFWPQSYAGTGLLYAPVTVGAGDVDGDGKVDLALADWWTSVSMLRGNGSGVYAPFDLSVYSIPVWGTAASSVEAMVVADFNGDGRRDLAVVSSSGFLTVFLGRVDGTSGAGVQYPVGVNATALTAADFNGDGKRDLVTANGDGTLSLLLGNGDGAFQSAVIIATGSPGPLGGIVAGDFNNDAKQDVLVANAANADALLLLGNGNGTFQAARSVAAGSAPSRLAVADFNGDGKLDFASVVDDGNHVTVALGNGDGTFQPAVDYPAGYLTQDLAVADFDGDGKPDVAIVNVGVASGAAVLLGNGNGTLRPPISFPFGTGATRIAAADLNGDGRIDLAAINENATGNSLTVLINTTGMTLQAPVFTNGVPPAGVSRTSYSFAFTASGSPAPRFTLSNFSGVLHYDAYSWTFTDTGILTSGNQLVPGIYSGTVTASNGVAPDANYDFAIVVPKLAQTISFPPLPDAVFPCPPLTVSVDNTDYANCTLTPAATASSGLGVSFVSLTPAVCDYVFNYISQRIEFKRLSVGTCILRAEQSGDQYYAAAPRVERRFRITPAIPTVAILTPADHAGFVAPATITFTASAHNIHLDAPTTRIEYYLNGSLIGFSDTPPYSVAWPNLPVGTYTAFARQKDLVSANTAYSTDSTPITVVVSAAADQPTVTLTAPSDGSLYFAPASVTLSATASNATGTIARVDFYNGALIVGSATGPPYTFVWTGVRPGTYTITAKATSGGGVVATSAPATITVDTGLATPIAAFGFDETWNAAGLVKELVSNAPATRQGSVTQSSAPAAGAKPDTCKAANFAGGVIDASGLSASAVSGDPTTAAFWMYWNGTAGAMPLSWATQGLLFLAGGFGFTTTGTDVYGVASASLANGWHHVVAVFVNGGVAGNRLYIDGVQQSLTQRTGTPSLVNAVTSTSLRLGGQSGTAALRFGGQIDEVRVFQGSLAPSAMTDLAAAPSPCAPLKVQLLTPANNSAYNSPATVELTAIATNTLGPVSRIDYLNGATVLGSVYASGATFAWTGVAAGTYTLSAKVYDSVSGTSATSSPITVTVTAVASAMAASVLYPPNGTTFYMDYPVHVVVAATAAPSTTIINARADSDDAAVVASAYYAAPNYRFLWRPLTAGTHTLTIRLQDSTGLWKAMPPVTVNMVPGSPSTVYYYNDAAGSPIAGTDPNGTLLWDGSYYPYGERFNEEDATTKNGLWYTGKPVEDSTGLSYFGARWYNPAIGRFYGVDPKWFTDGNPFSFNRYGYANNNPYRFIDPDGLESLSCNIFDGAEIRNAPVNNAYANSFHGQAAASLNDAVVQSAISSFAGTVVRAIGAIAAEVAGASSGAAKAAGRLGNQATRAHVDQVATEMEQRGWTITGGGGRLPEEYLPGPGGARKGSSYPDITATKDGRTLRANTVDTYADGVTPTSREATNAARIREQTGEHLLLIPKP